VLLVTDTTGALAAASTGGAWAVSLGVGLVLIVAVPAVVATLDALVSYLDDRDRGRPL